MITSGVLQCRKITQSKAESWLLAGDTYSAIATEQGNLLGALLMHIGHENYLVRSGDLRERGINFRLIVGDEVLLFLVTNLPLYEAGTEFSHEEVTKASFELYLAELMEDPVLGFF